MGNCQFIAFSTSMMKVCSGSEAPDERTGVTLGVLAEVLLNFGGPVWKRSACIECCWENGPVDGVGKGQPTFVFDCLFKQTHISWLGRLITIVSVCSARKTHASWLSRFITSIFVCLAKKARAVWLNSLLTLKNREPSGCLEVILSSPRSRSQSFAFLLLLSCRLYLSSKSR